MIGQCFPRDRSDGGNLLQMCMSFCDDQNALYFDNCYSCIYICMWLQKYIFKTAPTV